VAASASSEDKRALCVRLGAEAAWDPGEAGEAARAWTDREGVDVVIDSGGAATWASSMRALRWGGTYATCGATGGHDVALDLRALFYKRIMLVGATMGSREDMRAAWDAALAYRVRAHVDAVLPMSRIADAHARLEGRAVVGKLVLAQDLA
jgi:NADPH:quinone reductase-like Zn-dependent oxidoreductase